VALKETCRVVEGRVPLIDLHLARLSSGGCSDMLVERVRERILATAAEAADHRYRRLLVVVDPAGDVRTTLDERPSKLEVAGGPTFHLVYVTGAPSLPPGAAKPADRTPWDAAMAEARSEGCDQAVLADSEGAVIDAATANVWVAWADRIFTPPAPPAVAGVARRYVLDHAREAGIRPEVAHIRASDLLEADEVFFTSALAGVVAASGRSGSVVARLREMFADLLEPSA
jgi:branched-subunit amino acid aminotransferase/4-amino-4-deoxychorismate lyase